MEEAPKNDEESSHSAHANGMIAWMNMCNAVSSSKFPLLAYDTKIVRTLHPFKRAS